MARFPRQLLSVLILGLPFGGCSKEPSPPPKSSDPVKTGIGELDAFIASHKTPDAAGKSTDTTRAGWKTSLPKPPKLTFEPGKQIFWKLETNLGLVEVKLMPDIAPMHVSSTIYLTKLGFYDGLNFHRVIRQFMAQGGCPLGDGTGGPGYEFEGEFVGSTGHDRPYLLSMANAGPGTDGSQFFLTFRPAPELNGKHTVFGEVVDPASQRTLRAMEDRGHPKEGAPIEPIDILRATIEVR